MVTSISLPQEISSSSDLTGLILEVREYMKWYNQYANASRIGAAYTTEQPELSATASELIRRWAKQKELSSSRLDELTAYLEHTQNNAPVMTITLAAPATSEVKKALVTWCRTNVDPTILVTFRFNATILGGMVVRYRSAVYDWSFRRAILNERQRFAEVLQRV